MDVINDVITTIFTIKIRMNQKKIRAHAKARSREVPNWMRALDPRSNAALLVNTGGPASAETQRLIKDRWARIAAGDERLAGRRSQVERALGELRAQR